LAATRAGEWQQGVKQEVAYYEIAASVDPVIKTSIAHAQEKLKKHHYLDLRRLALPMITF